MVVDAPTGASADCALAKRITPASSSDAHIHLPADVAYTPQSPKHQAAPETFTPLHRPLPSTSRALPLDPYYDLTGPKLDMLKYGAAGNKAKRKAVQRNHSDAATPKKTFFDQPQRAAIESTPVASNDGGWPARAPTSPRHVPGSPPSSHHVSSTPRALNTTDASPVINGHASPAPPPTQLVPPSKRTDLPPNVRVTKVDVERKDWEAGTGKVIEGTSRDWVTPVVKAIEVSTAEVGTVEGISGDWNGWLTREVVEKRLAEGSLPVLRLEDAKDGQRVAVQVRCLRRHFYSPYSSLTDVLLHYARSSNSTPPPSRPPCRSNTVN